MCAMLKPVWRHVSLVWFVPCSVCKLGRGCKSTRLHPYLYVNSPICPKDISMARKLEFAFVSISHVSVGR